MPEHIIEGDDRELALGLIEEIEASEREAEGSRRTAESRLERAKESEAAAERKRAQLVRLAQIVLGDPNVTDVVRRTVTEREEDRVEVVAVTREA